ncbi:MAG: hypothetical protein O2958_03805 [Gemmatimonadetes bacterium]|nr:hypothetical protein [Gemmatimonadota bacterium]MDA1102445.1 hypothetical protein [Gemmatimonadota bacterium]
MFEIVLARGTDRTDRDDFTEAVPTLHAKFSRPGVDVQVVHTGNRNRHFTIDLEVALAPEPNLDPRRNGRPHVDHDMGLYVHDHVSRLPSYLHRYVRTVERQETRRVVAAEADHTVSGE